MISISQLTFKVLVPRIVSKVLQIMVIVVKKDLNGQGKGVEEKDNDQLYLELYFGYYQS